MILLDTNVVSEPLKPNPDPAVVQWLNTQAAEDLYLPAIVAAELYYGWSILPEGRRKRVSGDLIGRVVSQFEGRVVPFDLTAAVEYGRLMATARSAGVGLPILDGQIAAIARARGAALATRNVGHFEQTGIPLLNPWEGIG
ncbi:MAG: type II toxin-antitoxin system VapC family toxin [Kiloniellales bacterium]|nr:type II toxin-antitoxin system VapC family toxin [Kiloniellales bacterium]